MKLSKKRVASEFARRSMTNFAQITQPTIQLTTFHKTYYKILNEFAHGNIKRLIISIPPQHGKSFGSTTLLPAYALGINPNLKIAIASYNLSLASKFNRRIQRLIDSQTYGEIFPLTQLKKSASVHPNYVRNSDEFDIIGTGGGLLSVGREGSLTGNPVDMFILDDLYKDSLEANSPLIRENAWEWYNAVVKTRLHNDSQELIVFTRWHEDDLIGRIESHEQVVELTSFNQLSRDRKSAQPDIDCWYKLNFEAIKESSETEIDPRPIGMPLWKERHSLKLLTDKRRLDSQLFEAMYQGHPTSKEGLLYGNNFLTYDSLPNEIIRYANYTDTADSGEDFLCSVCYVTDLQGIIYITDVVYSQLSMEYTEEMVSEMLNANNTRIANIESNNGGRGFARSVQKMAPDCKIEWFHQSRNKEARILSNSSSVLRNIIMPRDWNQRWNVFYSHLTTYKRTFKANRWHDAADVITGIIEIEADSPTRKTIRAVRFKT